MKRLLCILALLAGCATPRPLHPPAPCSSWGQLPLVLAVDPTAAEYRAEIASAARAWDDALGRPAFVFAYVDEARADVVIETGPVERDIPRAVMTSSECPGGRLVTHMLLAPALSSPGVYAFAEHGLGHALGLGHATNEQSVMQHLLDVGLMSETWDQDHDQPHYRITEGDVERVLQLHPPARAVWLSPGPSWRAPLRLQEAAIPWILILTLAQPLITALIGKLFHSAVKETTRQQQILGYADTAFQLVEVLGPQLGLSGKDKYLRFVQEIVNSLKAAGQPELTAQEMQQLQNLAQAKAMLAKPAAAKLPLPLPAPYSG